MLSRLILGLLFILYTSDLSVFPDSLCFAYDFVYGNPYNEVHSEILVCGKTYKRIYKPLFLIYINKLSISDSTPKKC